MMKIFKVLILSILFFSYGVAVGNYGLFPYKILQNIHGQFASALDSYFALEKVNDFTSNEDIDLTETVTILEPDNELNSRAFASVIIHKDQYHIFYAGRQRETGRYSLYTRTASNLIGLRSAKDVLLLAPESVDAVMVWMPYIVKSGDQFIIFFTVRQGDISYYGDFNEFVMRLTSEDLEAFEVDSEVMVSAQFDWEGSEIENWGIIKVGIFST